MPRPIVTLVVAALALVGAACSQQPSGSRAVADHFMDLYYGQANVAEAVKLCSGAARTRLDGELQAIQGVKPDSAANKPKVTFDLTGSTVPSPTQATYHYRVTAHTADVSPVATTLTMVEDGGQWHVTSVNEAEGPPT